MSKEPRYRPSEAEMQALLVDQAMQIEAELLSGPISQRYERGATLITCTLAFDAWT